MGSFRALLVAASLTLGLSLSWAGGEQPNFDKVPEGDKVELAKRFEKDVWPLLQRNGKDGCVGCHTKNGSGLRFSGNPTKDFRAMLKDGFFLKDDAGSVVARLYEKDAKRKMPPAKNGTWTDADKKVVRDFVEELNRREK